MTAPPSEPIDAVDQFLRERDHLPQRCPSWCHGPAHHIQALEDGCSPEDASRHYGPDLGIVVEPVAVAAGTAGRTHYSNCRAQLQQEHHPDGRRVTPLIHVEISNWQRDGSSVTTFNQGSVISLTSGEARSLARQLAHLADLIDLE